MNAYVWEVAAWTGNWEFDSIMTHSEVSGLSKSVGESEVIISGSSLFSLDS